MSFKKFLKYAFATSLLIYLPFVQAAPELRLRVLYEDEGSDYVIPLGWFNARSNAPLELRGADTRRSLDLPISSRIKVEEAVLEMIYTNSISLLPRSQLAITMDERIIAQLPIKATQPDNGARIALPRELMKPGFHTLGFRGAHHYTNECEDPSAPELYSQIDARQSFLRIRASRQPIRASLARLSDIFDRRLWLDQYQIHVLMPQPGFGDVNLQEAAGQVVQAIAGLFQYIPIVARTASLESFALSPASPVGRFPGLKMPATSGQQGWDVVLLGTRAQLASYLHPDLLARITEGFIGLYPADEDATRAVLVISGVTPEQVRMAATALNLPGIALPERSEVLLSALDRDQGYRHLQLVSDEESGWTRFSRLGFTSTTMKGLYPRPARLEFWLSSHPRSTNPSQPYLDLELHITYGAGFDKKSALNVFLNEQFVQAIPMADKNGEQLYRVKVRLPMPALRIGANELRFVPSVIGEDVGGACQPIFTENLLITVFDDSRIQIPPVTDAMSLPDLGLMARTGLPYTRFADGRGGAILLASSSPDTLSQALNLQAKLRQVNRAPLLSLRMLANIEKDAKNLTGLIVVGAATQLPNTIREEMTAFLPQRLWQKVLLGENQQGVPCFKLFTCQTRNSAHGVLTLSRGLGESAALVQFVSPSLDIPVTVLTAASESILTRATEHLVEDALWGDIHGAAVLWSADGEVTATHDTGTRHIIGEIAWIEWMKLYLSEHAMLATAVVIAALLANATLTWWLLRRRAQAKGFEHSR